MQTENEANEYSLSFFIFFIFSEDITLQRCIPGSPRCYSIYVFNSDQHGCAAVPDFYNRLPI